MLAVGCQALVVVWRELLLFAAVGFFISGIDELAIDIIWIGRAAWRQLFIYSRHARVTAATLRSPEQPGPLAIFVAAWDEGAVIGGMLRHLFAVMTHGDFRVYLGVYPNDPATRAAAEAVGDERLRIVVGDRAGPTTKGDCLNTLWQAMQADEAASGVRVKAVVLHDAEDVVHPEELRVFDRLIEYAALVQLPVRPLINRQSRWVAGHYADEFADSHRRVIVVREALGAAVPSAGVGCAFARDMLGRIADAKGGAPFDPASLTEDYELELAIGALGGHGILARLPGAADAVEVNAHFPASLGAAARQKARWITGIALAGYDRLGWQGGWAERWMRLRDRRALIAALVLCVGYAVVVLSPLVWLLARLHIVPAIQIGAGLRLILVINAALLLWRLAVRGAIVGDAYGWREGVRAVPRAIVSNIIAMIAARRALMQYLRMRRTGIAHWEKTQHIFPTGLSSS